MKQNELLEQLKQLTQKEIKLLSLCESLGKNPYEILSLVHEIREEGINIITKKYDDDIYLFNQGEGEIAKNNTYQMATDANNEFKFVAISDTRFGSTSQQLSILNDIYKKAYDLGYMNVIHCGNISEGLYSITDNYANSNFLAGTLAQVDYITKYYPQIQGMTTYFMTGTKDEKHIKNNKINLGKRISDIRDDMIYLGSASCTINIDKVKMLVFHPKLGKTYTTSYRPQQQVDSFRSEDKPNILLYGGLLQMEKFPYRNVLCISVPSVCATTEEMVDKRYSNTVGAWYITVKTNKKGMLESVKAIDSVYYTTNKDDYKTAKVLRFRKEGC